MNEGENYDSDDSSGKDSLQGVYDQASDRKIQGPRSKGDSKGNSRSLSGGSQNFADVIMVRLKFQNAEIR